jgi:hypothetical protein
MQAACSEQVMPRTITSENQPDASASSNFLYQAATILAILVFLFSF